MTLRELAKGYNGRILLKAYESAAEEDAIAITENTNYESIKDEILDREVDNYLLLSAGPFHNYIRVNFNAVEEETENPNEETKEDVEVGEETEETE